MEVLTQTNTTVLIKLNIDNIEQITSFSKYIESKGYINVGYLKTIDELISKVNSLPDNKLVTDLFDFNYYLVITTNYRDEKLAYKFAHTDVNILPQVSNYTTKYFKVYNSIEEVFDL